jgi:hypothetical protein
MQVLSNDLVQKWKQVYGLAAKLKQKDFHQQYRKILLINPGYLVPWGTQNRAGSND